MTSHLRSDAQPLVVVNTWPWPQTTDAAWSKLESGGTAMDTVEVGCNTAEHDLSIPTVGYGGSPDEKGNTTLDAMIMDGDTMQVGAVASMERVKDAIRVARSVLNYTRHTLLVGPSATEFAQQMGFKQEPLETPKSLQEWKSWQANNCQPNFRRNVSPDPSQHCGPYTPLKGRFVVDSGERIPNTVDEVHHDTIGMLVLDKKGSLAVGTSTNGAKSRIPGRVGDSAIPGSGGYADSTSGAASATGDGDVMMRFLLSYQAVELMRSGVKPEKACQLSLSRVKQEGAWSGALVALNTKGEVGAACVGFTDFAISLRRSDDALNATRVIQIPCFNP